VVLVDASKSMTVADGPAGRTRWQELVAALAAARPAAEKLVESGDFAVATYVFDREVRPVPAAGRDPFPLTAWQAGKTSDQTAIGAALADAARGSAGRQLAGVVVLSDGRTTGGIDAPPVAARLAELGARVHAIGFGPTEAPANIALRNLSVPARVFTGDNVTATCAVTTLGVDRDTVDVELWLAPVGTDAEEAHPPEGALRRLTAATVTLSGSAGEPGAAKDEPRSGVASIEFEAPAVGAYLLEARVVHAKPDADPRDDRLRARFEGVDRRIERVGKGRSW
jgi:hypothetical protein